MANWCFQISLGRFGPFLWIKVAGQFCFQAWIWPLWSRLVDESGQRNVTILHPVKFLHTVGGNLLFLDEKKDEILHGHFGPLTVYHSIQTSINIWVFRGRVIVGWKIRIGRKFHIIVWIINYKYTNIIYKSCETGRPTVASSPGFLSISLAEPYIKTAGKSRERAWDEAAVNE